MPDANDWRPLYPFESKWLTLDGHRYHYIDEGQGEPLLLVHGNPTWSFHWRKLITALRGDYRLVAPDHIGCGFSDKPGRYPYRLEQHVRNLVALTHQLDLRNITLVAQDWGGAIGLGAATALLEESRFSRLVLFNTGAFRSQDMPLRIRACRMPVFGRVAVQGFNGFARAALRMAVENSAALSAAVQAGYLAPYDSWANRVATYEFVQDIPLREDHPSYAELLRIEQGLPKLRELPCLLVWGMRDWCFTPKFLDRFVAEFPQAQVHRLDDVGHWVMEEAPERVIPLVREFLAQGVRSPEHTSDEVK